MGSGESRPGQTKFERKGGWELTAEAPHDGTWKQDRADRSLGLANE